MRRTWIVIVILSLGLFAGCETSQKHSKIPPPPEPPSMLKAPQLRLQAAPLEKKPFDTDFPGQGGDPSVLLVKRKKHATEEVVTEFHRKNGGKIIKFKRIKWEAIKVQKGREAELYREYKKSGLFERVEFQHLYTVDAVPDDPLFGKQWALDKIAAPSAWDKTTGNDVVVAVVDTGIDFSHPDLAANLWTGPQGEHGYTAMGGVIEKGGRDDHYHGTHCAGVIAAVGNNNIGVAGINWRSKLLSMKFIGSGGVGNTVDAILCIEKMIDLKESGVNLRVGNNSWGGGRDGDDAALSDAFSEAEQAGIINVCAAGNNGMDIDRIPFSPAGFTNNGIVSVLASDENDAKANFSNYGMQNTDLLAPGVRILNCNTNGQYWQLSGTSMAAPHVAGALAMLFAFNPSLTVAQAKKLLLAPESYDRTSFIQNSTGGGRLNLSKLWNNPNIGNPGEPNRPPTMTLDTTTNFLVVPIGVPTTVTASATDPDADVLFYNVDAGAFRDGWYPQEWWAPHFAFNEPTNRITTSTLPLALDQRVNMIFSVTDGKGGGVDTNQIVWSFRDNSKVKDIGRGIQSFTTWFDDGTNFWFRLNVDTNIVPKGTAVYTVEVKPYPNPTTWDGRPNEDVKTAMKFYFPYAYTARPFLIDTNGNFATGPRAEFLYRTNGVRAPQCKMVLNTKRGVTPLEVVADLSSSDKGSVLHPKYGIKPWHSDAGWIHLDLPNPIRRMTLTEPGIYEFLFFIGDTHSLLEDVIAEFITVLPGPDPAALRLALERVPPAYNVHLYSALGVIADIEYTDSFSGTMLNTWAVLKRITNTTGHAIVPVPMELSNKRSTFFRAVSQ